MYIFYNIIAFLVLVSYVAKFLDVETVIIVFLFIITNAILDMNERGRDK